MQNEEVENPIPVSVQDLLKVFKEDLSDVTFPDVSLKVLETLAHTVENSAKELAKAQEAEMAAQQALEASQAELLQKSARAISYAKVYAEDKIELLGKLSQINLGKAGRVPKKAVADQVKTDGAVEAKEKAERKNAKAAKKAEEAGSAS
jgi:hypothetical protein